MTNSACPGCFRVGAIQSNSLLISKSTAFTTKTLALHFAGMTENTQHLQAPITAYIRKDFSQLRDNMNVQQALDFIRQQGVGEQIVYFYVVNEPDRLIGVLPTRRLLTAALDQR